MSRSTAYGHTDSPASAPPGLVGTIQPHGLLLVLHEPQLRIVQVSTSAARWLRQPLPALLLAHLPDLGGDAAAQLAPLLGALQAGEPRPLRCTLGTGTDRRTHTLALEGRVHRMTPDTVVLELEPCAAGPAAGAGAGPAPDTASHDTQPEPDHAALLAALRDAVQRFSEAGSVVALAVVAAQAVRALLGHDRVFVTEFSADGRGQVIAEDRAAPLSPWLGHNQSLDDSWPDPSARSRALYLHKRVRVLVDAGATPSELLPALPPGSAGGHDLTLSELRSTSAAHATRLRTHGVAASVVAALVRDGRLWGLVTCHHPRPRRPSHALRAALELLAEVFMTRVVALENYARAQVRAEVRRLEQRLLEAASLEGDWRAGLFRNQAALLQPMEASAALLWHEGELLSCGDAPRGEALQTLVQWLQAQPAGTAPLQHSGLVLPGGDSAPAQPRSVLAVRLSDAQPDALLWLRPVDPVSGQGLPWTGSDLSLAHAYGTALVDMILQVNAVRLLLAERQLAQLRAAVAGSQEAAVVTDAGQRSFYPNTAFLALSGRRRDEVTDLAALAALFTQPAQAQRAFGQVRAEHRPWQGELELRRADGRSVPVAVRAEPVHASEHPLLGCIFIFEDRSEAHEADALRQRLEQALTRATREAQPTAGRDLVGAIIANASLAAMDIADGGPGLAAAPLLAEVEARTARATSLLEQIREIATSEAGRPAAAAP